MDYRETGWGAMGWIYLAQDKDHWQALVKTVIESSGSIKYLEILEQLSDWFLLKQGSASLEHIFGSDFFIPIITCFIPLHTTFYKKIIYILFFDGHFFKNI
jgi:hypothetical protein